MIQLFANAPEKAEEDGPSTWASATYVRDLDETPGSWPPPGPAPALVVFWRVNQKMADSLPPLQTIPLAFHPHLPPFFV